MKCPECNSDILIAKDEQWLYSQYYEPKTKGVGYKKTPIRKTIDKRDGLFDFSLICLKCGYIKHSDDKLTQEEQEVIDWAVDNLMTKL